MFLKPLEKEEPSPIEELQSEDTAISDLSTVKMLACLLYQLGEPGKFFLP